MKKNLNKKLLLNKKTIAILNHNDLNDIRGREMPKTDGDMCTATCTCAIHSQCACQQLDEMR